MSISTQTQSANRGHDRSISHYLPSPEGDPAERVAYLGQLRKEFAEFIRRNQRMAKEETIDTLIEKSGVPIGRSAAYRVAYFNGARGFRTNRSRYEEFWSQLNWNLPDTDLAEIWNVDRGNVQSKRRFLHKQNSSVPDRPLWSRVDDEKKKTYQRAKEDEKEKASRNKAPRPAASRVISSRKHSTAA